MTVKTEFLNKQQIISKRIRWSKSGSEGGPVIVLFVGIHGNETAGVLAMGNIANALTTYNGRFTGTVYAISGNLKALHEGVRFVDTDLNRLWEAQNINKNFPKSNGTEKPSEYEESRHIKTTIEEILEKHREDAGEFIFADLHTTSSESCAFILLNDTLANREIARTFPAPQILGIEENIHGTLLSYINNLGYRAIGFEAGAHDNKESVKRSEAFIWLLFHNCGMIELSGNKIDSYKKMLHAHPGVPETYYEIRYHHPIQDPDDFRMLKGFENFDIIEKGTALAYENGELIEAPVSGRIFMPLYQKAGRDGFLIIRPVSEFWLTLSAYVRNCFIHSYMHFLPGVKKIDEQAFIVDLKTARFLVRDIFHLLGYRVTEKDENTLICFRR